MPSVWELSIVTWFYSFCCLVFELDHHCNSNVELRSEFQVMFYRRICASFFQNFWSWNCESNICSGASFLDSLTVSRQVLNWGRISQTTIFHGTLREPNSLDSISVSDSVRSTFNYFPVRYSMSPHFMLQLLNWGRSFTIIFFDLTLWQHGYFRRSFCGRHC